MREIRTSGLMSGDRKRNYGTNCDTGMGESRRQTVQPRSLRPPRQSSTYVRPEGAHYLWREVGELSIDPVADERLG